MTIILFDNNARESLYPFTQTKAVADLRFGIFTAKERWELISGLPVYINTKNYLSDLYEKFVADATLENDFLFIDAALRDEDAWRTQILSLQIGEAIYDDIGLIAGRTNKTITDFGINTTESFFENVSVTDTAQRLQFPWKIAQWNDEQLRRDFLLLFSRMQTQPVSETNKIIQAENIIIEEGAVVEHCIINASTGPVYIGKNATVMEGSILRGPVAICEGATVKMGAKIYGATTVGPYCTVGGEIKNSVLQSFSNKAHDGYLGDAVIGSWCNLGAGTSNSNVKNSAADIFMFNNAIEEINVGKKCGVIMGDYSRTAINTPINTGTIIGICCSILSEGLTPNMIDNFSWGMKNASVYEIHKAIEHINNWKKLKGEELSDAEISVLKYIFEKRQSNNIAKKSSKRSNKN
jgi:UDP-N-acetylglucosamine diphosphorylase/glucosamine-1-phosphate N-acetyltransferase